MSQPNDGAQTQPGRDPPTGRPDRPSPGRGLLFGGLGSLGGAVGLGLLGGPLSLTAGLLVVVFITGRLVGWLVRAGAAASLSSRARSSIAVALALGGTTLGLGGMWLWAMGEGGRLGFVEFLADVYGPLIPLEYLIVTLTAWWSAR
jgi:hypothetical protein